MMDQEKNTEALDELISDIHDLIDENETAMPPQETVAEVPAPEETVAEQIPEAEVIVPEVPVSEFPEPALPVQEVPAPAVPAEPVVAQKPKKEKIKKEKPKKEKNKKPEGTPDFQDQRWTDRQRVPKHVAKLQRNQEEAYAKWLEEQQERGDEPPVDLPDEEDGGKSGSGHIGGKKKRRGLMWFCIILAVLTLIAAVVMVFMIPRQPVAPDVRDRVKGVSTILVAGTDDTKGRTEALLLLSFHSQNKTMSVIGLPTDIMVQSGERVMPLGEVYGRSGGGAEGVKNLKEAVGDCVGIVPDGCLVLYPDAVTEFVDTLGTVKFKAPYEVKTKAISLSKGQARLTGAQSYALLRHTDETVDKALRLQTQEQFLAAVVKQCTSFGSVLKAPLLLDQLTENAVTDLNTENLLWLARTAMIMDHDKTYTATLPGTQTEAGFLPDGAAIIPMINQYCNPYVRAATEEDLRMIEP